MNIDTTDGRAESVRRVPRRPGNGAAVDRPSGIRINVMTADAAHLTAPCVAGTPGPGHDLKSAPMPELGEKLDYSQDGLSKADATRRLAHYGPNEIADHKTNPLLKFLSYFWGPIPWMIEIAVILSGAVGHWPSRPTMVGGAA
jgi:magnesium-transporting ATPase (P-type)